MALACWITQHHMLRVSAGFSNLHDPSKSSDANAVLICWYAAMKLHTSVLACRICILETPKESSLKVWVCNGIDVLACAAQRSSKLH